MRSPSISRLRTWIGGASAAFCFCLTTVSSGLAEEQPANAQQATPEQAAFFEKQIRPLLVQHCIACHGPEEQNGGLRLDRHALLAAGGDSGPAIVPGQPDASRLIRGVKYDDLNFQMPPEGKLSDEEIAFLVAWVKQGAPWPAGDEEPVAKTAKASSPAERMEQFRAEHWSYQPVQLPPLPAVQNEAWAKTPLDRFVLAQLTAQGLQPNPPAEKAILLRRAYFDLIGLPPSYEEVAAFVADESPDAFAKVIDRLLQNPHYGERWARHWLDIARYSDTMGYMGVGAETRYPYAYTYRDWVIDAFNSDKPYNRFILEQLAADQLELPADDHRPLAGMGFLNVGRRFGKKSPDHYDDQIDVVSRGFLGLSVACARCHDHKYDPIPTADYYSLYGVFASSEEPETLPLLGAPPQTPLYQQFEQGLAQRQKKVDDWVEDLRRKVEGELRSRASDYLVYTARTFPKYDTGNVKQQGKSGFLRPAALQRWKAFLHERGTDQTGIWRLWQELAALPKEEFAAQSASLLAAYTAGDAKDASPGARRIATALQAQPALPSMPEAAERFGKVLEEVHAAWQAAVKADPKATALPDAAAEEIRQALLIADSPLVLRTEHVAAHFTQGERAEYTKLEKEVQAFEFSHPGAPPRAMVLEDKPELVEPVIFRRGQPGNRGDQVPRRFLHILSQVDGGQPFQHGSGRLELAQAIASEKNPLTARVLVNRIWQYHFGAGLVRTPSDFGMRGERPTHPELLDYLAARFMQQDWSIKQLHREILLSATWQQASTDQPAARKIDPENRLLWKMNRRRLEFEPLRDSLLLAAGKLDLTIGGRSVNIHEGAPRRGLYAFVDREDIPGLLAAFDVPNPDATTAVRSETTVPQQALFLMNSPLLLEQARGLAARTAGAESAAARVQQLYQLALARNPDADELALAKQFVEPASAESLTGQPAAAPKSPWQFGRGKYDAAAKRLIEFQPLPHFTGNTWQAGTDFPHPTWHYLQLSAGGGHPGWNDEQAAIRRWVSPIAGTVKLSGLLQHPAEQGNGVQAWLVSSRQGELGAWTVHHSEAATNLESITVEAGETLDFIVGPRGEHSWDSFGWAPMISQLKATGAAATTQQPTASQPEPAAAALPTWNAAADFAAASAGAPIQPQLDPWVQLAQVLLLSNEFVFVD